MSAMSSARTRVPLRARVTAVLALVALVVMVGCGARLDTQLVIKPDGSGSRTITGTVSKADMEELTGGTATVDALVKTSIPAGMTYGGSKAASDGGAVFTFVITFTSIDDYKKKAQTILAAGDVLVVPEVTYQTSTPPFSDGVRFKENFTSQQLLAWLVKAIEASGKAGDTSASNLTEAGTLILTVDGAQHKARYEPVSFGEVENYGFSRVAILTSGFGGADGQYVRQIGFQLNPAAYARDPKGYDAYLTKAAQGGKVTPMQDQDAAWVVELPKGTPDKVAAMTDVALSTTGSTFDVKSEPDANNPMEFTTTITSAAKCGVVCQPEALVFQSVAVPEGWGVQGQKGENGTTVVSLNDGVGTITHSVQLTGSSVALALTSPESVSATVSISLAAADDEQSKQAAGSLLASLGTPARTVKGDQVSYTVTAKADSVVGLSNLLKGAGFAGATSGSPVLSVLTKKEGMVTTSSTVSVNLMAPKAIADLLPADRQPSWSVTGPAGEVIAPSLLSDGDGKANAVVESDAVAVKSAVKINLAFTVEEKSYTAVLVLIGAVVLVLGGGAAAAVIALKRRRSRGLAQPIG